ncbi:MAG: hypothetical protein KDA17_05020 [Candidatus Saccharibacteria bacterium]|nr:hypothetical protein [Candidatus Saccharibacteria bacterium]
MFDLDQGNETKAIPVEVRDFSFTVVREDPFGFYKVKYKGDYELSPELKGRFTEMEKAVIAINTFVEGVERWEAEQVEAAEEIDNLQDAIEEKEKELAEANAEVEAMKPKD